MNKTCIKCKIKKDVNEFHKNKIGIYGVRNKRKKSVKKKYKENKEQKKE